MAHDKIFVTQPFLPPLEEFIPHLQDIWSSKVLTNGGPKHQQFEKALETRFGLDHVCLFNNGTIALLTALQALDVSGEVITTPYSFVATSHALLWCGLKPVFVDVDKNTLNIDPERIEAAITPETTAILAVHCYGNPCDTSAIKEIARRHNLRVIYDAAHAFGVEDAGGSVLRHGDLSTLSFHATKVFNTFEGGAIVCPDAGTKTYVDQLKNFGFVDEVTVVEAGINGKMSEINAAFGLLQLEYVDGVIAERAKRDAQYRERLSSVRGVKCLGDAGQTIHNFAYFPILMDDSFPLTRDRLCEKLRERDIYPRRYFYPLISDFPMYRHFPSASRSNLPVAAAAADRVVCLPLYPDLDPAVVEEVCDLIGNEAHNGAG